MKQLLRTAALPQLLYTKRREKSYPVDEAGTRNSSCFALKPNDERTLSVQQKQVQEERGLCHHPMVLLLNPCYLCPDYQARALNHVWHDVVIRFRSRKHPVQSCTLVMSEREGCEREKQRSNLQESAYTDADSDWTAWTRTRVHACKHEGRQQRRSASQAAAQPGCSQSPDASVGARRNLPLPVPIA